MNHSSSDTLIQRAHAEVSDLLVKSSMTGIITTVAASAIEGDGDSAILQSIEITSGLAVVANGDFYFSNEYLNVVKKVTYTTGTPSSSVTSAPHSHVWSDTKHTIYCNGSYTQCFVPLLTLFLASRCGSVST